MLPGVVVGVEVVRQLLAVAQGDLHHGELGRDVPLLILDKFLGLQGTAVQLPYADETWNLDQGDGLLRDAPLNTFAASVRLHLFDGADCSQGR